MYRSIVLICWKEKRSRVSEDRHHSADGLACGRQPPSSRPAPTPPLLSLLLREPPACLRRALRGHGLHTPRSGLPGAGQRDGHPGGHPWVHWVCVGSAPPWSIPESPPHPQPRDTCFQLGEERPSPTLGVSNGKGVVQSLRPCVRVREGPGGG